MKMAASNPISEKTATNNVAFAFPIAVNSTGNRKMDRKAGS
jgi:hypothetical protein